MRGGRACEGGRDGELRECVRPAEEGVVVEGEQLDAAVDGLGGDFGVAEAACRRSSRLGMVELGFAGVKGSTYQG
jgi:hypothetical protein